MQIVLTVNYPTIKYHWYGFPRMKRGKETGDLHIRWLQESNWWESILCLIFKDNFFFFLVFLEWKKNAEVLEAIFPILCLLDYYSTDADGSVYSTEENGRLIRQFIPHRQVFPFISFVFRNHT